MVVEPINTFRKCIREARFVNSLCPTVQSIKDVHVYTLRSRLVQTLQTILSISPLGAAAAVDRRNAWSVYIINASSVEKIYFTYSDRFHLLK